MSYKSYAEETNEERKNTLTDYNQHPEDYAQKCNAATAIPNNYMNSIPYPQTGLGAALAGQAVGDQSILKQFKAQQASGHSNLARSASGLGQAIQKKTLQDEAAQVRSLAEQLSGMLSQLEYAMFEPVPTPDSCQTNPKDNPSTVEGSVLTAVRTLQTAQYTLERILVKIGGR